MIEKWVNFKRDYLEISFLRENCGYDGSDDCRRYVPVLTVYKEFSKVGMDVVPRLQRKNIQHN